MEKFIQLETHRVHVQFLQSQLMEEKRYLLVFLHEALGSIIQWKQFPSQLCSELALPGIVIERQGHGLSDPLHSPRNATYLHNYAQELKAILQEIVPMDKKVILVGHSDGGTIALLYAHLWPSRVKALITMAAHTFVEEVTVQGIQPAIEAFEAGKLNGLYTIHGEKTTDLFYAWANTWKQFLYPDWDIREEILDIPVPIFALQGSNDQYGTIAQLESIQRIGSHVQIAEIAGCGHHPHLEKQEETRSFIAKWLQFLN